MAKKTKESELNNTNIDILDKITSVNKKDKSTKLAGLVKKDADNSNTKSEKNKSSSKKSNVTKKSLAAKNKATKKALSAKEAKTEKKALSIEETQATKKNLSAKETKTENNLLSVKETKATKKKLSAKETKVPKKASSTNGTKTKKASSTKRTSTKKASTRSKATVSKSKKPLVDFKAEYYDLPYMYNKTVVKVLAQTPKMLFIYWEISEDDKAKFKKLYGENFFEITRPVLIVFNDTMHYSFEVDINDFANSWYLHINDADCNYHVELGRRPYADIYHDSSVNLNNAYSNNTGLFDSPTEQKYIPYYVYVTSSNKMTAPNNKILFDTNLHSVKFKNIKTGQTFERNIKQFTFITNIGIFNIQDLYKSLYPNENFEVENVFIGNPSSGLTSSGMFSSQFK